GVCVGVAALIVILSVMNGFEGELRDRLLSLSAHARVVAGLPGGGAAPGSVPPPAAAGDEEDPARAVPTQRSAGGGEDPARAVPAQRWNDIRQAAGAAPGVRAVAPYVELEALAVRTPEMLPVVLRG